MMIMTIAEEMWCGVWCGRVCHEASDQRWSYGERFVPDTLQEQHEGRPVVHDEDREEDEDVDDDERRARLHEGHWDGRPSQDTMRGASTQRRVDSLTTSLVTLTHQDAHSS